MRAKLWMLLAMVVLAGLAFGETTTSLPFIKDNFAKALAEAKQQNKPMFVECWAPW